MARYDQLHKKGFDDLGDGAAADGAAVLLGQQELLGARLAHAGMAARQDDHDGRLGQADQTSGLGVAHRGRLGQPRVDGLQLRQQIVGPLLWCGLQALPRQLGQRQRHLHGP